MIVGTQLGVDATIFYLIAYVIYLLNKYVLRAGSMVQGGNFVVSRASLEAIGGFNTAAVRAEFGLGETLTPVVVIAIGRRDPIADLPEPLAARETAPRTRHPVSKLLLPEVSAPQLAAA